MKKITLIVIVFLLIMGFNKFSFDKYMEEGRQSIINKEYIKARDLFEKAVNKKEDNKEARALYKQSQILVEVINLKKDNSFEEAMDLCQNINNTDSEDNIIRKLAEQIKEECSNYLKDSKEYEDDLNRRIDEGTVL